MERAVVISSGNIKEDRINATNGKIVAIAHNEAEAVLMICQPDKKGNPVWYIQAHMSVAAGEGTDIADPFYYINRVGYLEESWESLAMVSKNTSNARWEEIYTSINSRVGSVCPFEDDCTKKFCPFGRCRKSQMN